MIYCLSLPLTGKPQGGEDPVPGDLERCLTVVGPQSVLESIAAAGVITGEQDTDRPGQGQEVPLWSLLQGVDMPWKLGVQVDFPGLGRCDSCSPYLKLLKLPPFLHIFKALS